MPTSRASALLLIVVSFSVLAFATAQEGDILFLNGKQYSIYTNPLRGFLEKNPGILPKSGVISSANWRGYVATWEVKDNRLLLTDVTILRSVKKPDAKHSTAEPHSVMADMFLGQKEVVADWFTGHIIVPNGKLVNYVHMGYASTYKKYILLRVEAGAVTRQWNANTSQFFKFRDAQFAAFKRTEEYRKALAEATQGADAMSATNAEEFLRQFYSERYMSMIFE